MEEELQNFFGKLIFVTAVYFEQGEYTKCIETCEKAVEEGRDLRADYKVIAKFDSQYHACDGKLITSRAFGRIGSAYSKLDDLENAVKFYSKSLTEHRTPDILTKLRETEKAKAEADRKSYIDPQKAEAAREEGNTAFKVCLSTSRQYLLTACLGRGFRDSSQAVHRGDQETSVRLDHFALADDYVNRTDPRGYNNRASAYHKLLAMPEALKDAQEAIKIDPSFIKAYIRKALTQQAMKELTGSLETLQKATEMDVEKKVSGCSMISRVQFTRRLAHKGIGGKYVESPQ